MESELRPTPVVKGRAARIFYREVRAKEMTPEQDAFVKECLNLLNNTKS